MIKKNLLKAEEISRAFAGKSRSSQRCRHFSFIFDRSKLLSIGINSGKTHPLNLRYNYVNRENDSIGSFVGTHSEMSAVLKLGPKSCKGLIMVNTRMNRNDEMDYSFPCKGCMDMIKKLGFKSVFYTTKNKDFGVFELS
jgi:hypothetical protein